MRKGWLIYTARDYEKNKVYAKMLIDYGIENGLEINLLIRENLKLGIKEKKLTLYNGEDELEKVDFIINRSRDSQLAWHLELMGSKVFNSSKVTEIANDKGKTHQFVNGLGIASVDTILYDKSYMSLENCIKKYPVVIKSADGHGGEEVYKAHTLEEARDTLELMKGNKLLIQALCTQVGVDVRVFVIGGEIVGAIKRCSKVDFRSNYSLGGEASRYDLSEKEQRLVYQILDHLPCDFVGIDFMVDKDGDFIFNEIEDAVGSRTLYAYTEVDSAKLYISHIKSVLVS